jgi:hypothetical protein
MRTDAKPFKGLPMPKSKKSKGVLERIGEVATSAAEVVIDAGSKAMHAVGNMMPSGTSQKSAKPASKSSKKSTPKAAAKISRASQKAVAKGSKPKVAVKSKTAAQKAAKLSTKRTLTTKVARPTKKASPKKLPGKKR